MTFQPGTIVTKDQRDLLKEIAVAEARDILLKRIDKQNPHLALKQIEAIQNITSDFNKEASALIRSRMTSAIGIMMIGQHNSHDEFKAMLNSAFDSASAILIKKIEKSESLKTLAL